MQLQQRRPGAVRTAWDDFNRYFALFFALFAAGIALVHLGRLVAAGQGDAVRLVLWSALMLAGLRVFRRR